MDGNIFIEGLGLLFFAMVFQLISLIVIRLIHYVIGGTDQCLTLNKYVGSFKFLPIFTRFLLEGYVEIVLTGSITIYFSDSKQFENPWEIFSTVFCYVLMFISVVFPFWLAKAGFEYMRFKMMKPKVSHKHSLIFKEFKPRPMPILYHTFFVLRRIILIASIIVLKNRPDICVYVFVYSSLMWNVYQCNFMPMRNSKSNRYEIVNELLVMCFHDMLMLNSDLTSRV